MAKKLLYNYVFTPGGANAGTVVVPGNIPLRRLLLITNATAGTIIYNFADSTKNATYSYNSTLNETTFTLEFSTTGMSAVDQLQIFYEVDEIQVRPGLTYQDPVEKMRVSAPQSMIDTDFEYSLQASKWESVGLVNNMPSVFVAANEPAFTNDQINYLRVVSLGGAGGGGAGSLATLSSNIPANRGSTGLTAVYGAYGNGGGTDEGLTSMTLPANYQNRLWLGNTYSGPIYFHGNGWMSWVSPNIVTSYASYPQNPASPSMHFWTVNNGFTDNSMAFIGYEVYTDAFWGEVLRIRGHWNYLYYSSNYAQQTHVDFYMVRSQPGLYLIVLRQFTSDGQNEQLAVSNGTSAQFYSALFQNSTPFSAGQAWQINMSGGIVPYNIEVNFTINHTRSVGNPISVRESGNVVLDGAYIVSNVDSATTFRYLPRAYDSTIEVENKTGTYSQTGNTVTVTYTSHGYKIGDSIWLQASSGSLPIGTYEVLENPSPTANIFYVYRAVSQSTSGSLTMFKNYKTPYTAIYTGGFYSNSQLTITNIIRISGTANARITFPQPHGLFIGSPIYVIDTSQTTADWVGAFIVAKILSEFILEYTTRSASTFSDNNTLSTNATVYAKADSLPTHRSGDGGVQINPGNTSVNAQIIRQTRKYFRYQSGKGIQFSTGILMRPVYDVNNVTVDTSTIGSGYIELTIETEIEHGFSVPTGAGGPVIRLRGFTVSTGTNPYNVTTSVQSVNNNKIFKCRITTGIAPGDTNPGGFRQVEVTGWFDATVRTGLFDEQNGLFFEFNGTELFMVRRNSTQQLAGTATIVPGSGFIYGQKSNWQSTLAQGDYIVVNGQSMIINRIYSNTKMAVTPRYRAAATAANIKLFKTQELRFRQKDFTLDQLDGSGPSGYTLDLNRMQMVFIDYSWYGAGKVRFGIRVNDGNIIYFHEIPNNNTNTEAYMRSGNLPGRFEIQNRSNRTALTSVGQFGQFFSWSYGGSFATVATISATSHGLAIGDSILFDFNATISDGIYEVQSASFTTNSFQIIVPASRDAASGTGNFFRIISSSQTVPFTVTVQNAQYFPATGSCMINNEYFLYNKWNNLNNANGNNTGSVSATYNQTGNIITVNGYGSAYGLAQGDSVNLVFTSGTAANEAYTVLTVASTSFTVSSYYPQNTSGNVNVYNNTRLTITERNRFGLTTQINASTGNTVYSVNQNCSPALSHWGTSVIMDGRFDEDKSYLFTGSSGPVNFNNTLATKPVISVRLSPSADYGIPRDFGIRSLINRSAITLKRVGAYTRGTGYLMEIKINCSSAVFEVANNWRVVGNGSLSQYLDHAVTGGTVTGGDTVFAFFAEEGSGRFAVTDKEIDFIRDLGNSILGGARQYPDGPDILTIFATPTIQVSNNADVRARLSWTEAQG